MGPSPTPRLPLVEHPLFTTRRVGSPPAAELPEIFIFSDVLEELCYRAAYAPDETSVSLLTGGYYVGPYGPYLEIEGFRDSLATEGPLDFLDYIQHHPALLDPPPSPALETPVYLLGCAFARPGCEGRMAPEDLILFNTLFNHDHHTLLLIDAPGDVFSFFLRDGIHGRFHNCPVTLLSAV